MSDQPLRFCGRLAAAVFFFGTALFVNAASPLPLFDDLSSYSRPVTTSSPVVQRYFDQGLAFTFGFDHERAIESFQEAARLDPQCAMAWWGIANACGPNINGPTVDAAHDALAREAITRAQAAMASGTPTEQALIRAQAKRFGASFSAERRALDEAYAAAMREAWHAHPDDADIAVLFAESLLDLRPWDQWQPDGRPQPGTEEALAALKVGLSLRPDHPLGLHLTIHAYEASPHPEDALPAANRLRGQRSMIGHLEHMASHIDVRVGNWAEAVESNERAIQSDLRYRRVVGAPTGVMPVYMAHNRHMQAYAAVMTGQRDLALRTIRAMVAEISAELPPEFFGYVDGFSAMPYEVMVRFGQWDEILALPVPGEKYVFSRAVLFAARGIAQAALGRPAEARKEQTAFIAARALVPADSPFSTNTMGNILAVAEAMLDGEVLFREGQSDAGLAQLREAVRREDALHYDEPPPWIIPVRHALGAALLQVGRVPEAEQVYRDDLKKLPRNGWALFGLARSLQLQDKSAEAAVVEKDFAREWAKADVELKSSCLCQPGV